MSQGPEVAMARRQIFSSESATQSHLHKIRDQIADVTLDAFLEQYACAEVAAECAVSTCLVFLAVTSVAKASADVTRIARDVIRDIGYSAESGFDPDTC